VISVLASKRDEGQRKVLAVQKGLRSLLRGTRSRQGRRRIAPLFWCVVAAGVLTMPAAAWAQPRPDQPPPRLPDDAPAALEPDAPVRAVSTAPAPASPPAPPDHALEAPQPPQPQPQSEVPVLPAVTKPRAQPAGRHFVLSTKPQRRFPPVVEAAADRTISLSSLSYEPNSRPYVLAALCLVVLVLGSGTLLTVLARLRPTRERTA
jgi:hypothetical protein